MSEVTVARPGRPFPEDLVHPGLNDWFDSYFEVDQDTLATLRREEAVSLVKSRLNALELQRRRERRKLEKLLAVE